MRRVAVGVAACVALAIGLSACSSTVSQDRPVTSTSDAAAAHNDADVAFLQQMIPHHAQAIEMSNLLLTKAGADPQVVAQALSIRIKQASEIEMMRGWLTTWGLGPTAEQQPHHSGQCGMVSPAELAALNDAEGNAKNRLYLELMITHHEGAIAMARTEADFGQSSFATDFARGIMSSQQREIDVMRTMLTPEITVNTAPVVLALARPPLGSG